MNLADWYEKGMTAQTYIDAMRMNKEELQSIYDRFQVSNEDEAQFAELKAKNLRAIVLTEDWCGDAMVNVPILLKIAEKANIDVRMLLRDENLELMDQYLTNGTARAIPIFIFIDEAGNETAVWGPRAPEAQQLVDEERAKLPEKDAPDFKEKQLQLYKDLNETFTKDEQLWTDIYESIMNRLK